MSGTARRRWTAGNSSFTDDGDGVVREWDATTFAYIRALSPVQAADLLKTPPSPNTDPASPEAG